MEEISGVWTGMMLDAEGSRARGQLELKQSGGEIEGVAEITLIFEESTEAIKGEVRGKTGTDGALTLIQEFPEANTRVVFEGRAIKTDVHAEGSIFGTYAVEGREGLLSGGVAIFWRYRGEK